jgi:hypothetical protein
MASSLRTAYQEQADGGAVPTAPDANYAPLTHHWKPAIANEIHSDLPLENSEGLTAAHSMPHADSSGIARMLSDGLPHVFVASTFLNVPSRTGECVITAGDVIQLNGALAPGAAASNAVVLASKGQDCRRGDIIAVQLADLQEMQNHMRETVDDGLASLQSRLGQNGLPAAPAMAMNAPVQPAYAAIPLDANVASLLSQDARQAEQAEGDVAGLNVGSPAPEQDATDGQAQPRPSRASRFAFWGQVIGDALTGSDVGTQAVQLIGNLKSR